MTPAMKCYKTRVCWHALCVRERERERERGREGEGGGKRERERDSTYCCLKHEFMPGAEQEWVHATLHLEAVWHVDGYALDPPLEFRRMVDVGFRV